MNEFPTREQVNKIRELYPVGTIIRLTAMKDPYHPVPNGTLGKITDIDDIGNLIMKWQNGQGLNLLPCDKFEVVLKPNEQLTRKHTVTNSNDFENKIVIIKAELLEEMHRTPLKQLWAVVNSADLQSDSDAIALQHIDDETLLCTATRNDILGVANDAVIQMYVEEQNQILSQEKELGINNQRYDLSY